MDRGLGYTPDEADGRDANFAVSTVGFSASVPERIDFSGCVLDVLDQGPLGSCVLNGFFQGVRTRARAKGDTASRTAIEIASRLHGYWHSRNQHGDAKRDSGTMIRTAIKVSNKNGRPFESAWPYVVSDLDEPEPTFTKKPPPTVVMQAIDNRAAAFHRIASYDDQRWKEIKATLAQKIPIVFGTDLGASFRRYDGGGALDIPNDEIIGGHAMLLIGYDSAAEEAIGVNSWGIGWGDRGFFRITKRYLTWYRTRDLWALDLP